MSLSDLLHLLELVMLGAGLGFAGGLFGIGGGIVAIPVLTIGFGATQATAQGTALVLMVPNLLIAWWRYARHNPTPLKEVAGIALVSTITTWATAQLAHWLDQAMLRSIFALFLLYLAVRMTGMVKPAAETHSPHDRKFLPLVGIAGGSSMGLLGVGGGLVATPLFARFFGLSQRAAQSLGLALVAPSSVIALGAYAQNQQVDWHLGIPLAVGGLFTVASGVALAHRLPEKKLRFCFGVMVGLTSLWLLLGKYIIG